MARGWALHARVMAGAVLLLSNPLPSAVSEDIQFHLKPIPNPQTLTVGIHDGPSTVQIINGRVQYTHRVAAPGCDRDVNATSVPVRSAAASARFWGIDDQTVRLVSLDVPLVPASEAALFNYTLTLAFHGMAFTSQTLQLLQTGSMCQTHSFAFRSLRRAGLSVQTRITIVHSAPVLRDSPLGQQLFTNRRQLTANRRPPAIWGCCRSSVVGGV